MTYHFYFKNSEPVYETEYKQSLKQFAVQEVFPAYVLKLCIGFVSSNLTLKQSLFSILHCLPGKLYLAFLDTATGSQMDVKILAQV